MRSAIGFSSLLRLDSHRRIHAIGEIQRMHRNTALEIRSIEILRSIPVGVRRGSAMSFEFLPGGSLARRSVLRRPAAPLSARWFRAPQTNAEVLPNIPQKEVAKDPQRAPVTSKHPIPVVSMTKLYE